MRGITPDVVFGKAQQDSKILFFEVIRVLDPSYNRGSKVFEDPALSLIHI